MPSWLHGMEEFGFAHTYHLYSFMGWGVGVAKPKPYLFSLCVFYMYNFKSYYMLWRGARLAVKSNSFFAYCSRFAQSHRTAMPKQLPEKKILCFLPIIADQDSHVEKPNGERFPRYTAVKTSGKVR